MSGFWLEGAAGAMSATVHEGRAVIAAGATRGAYPVTLPEPSALTFTDGDATNPRIDLVVLRIYDSLYDNSGQTKAALEIIKGTPAATPVAPVIPGIGLALYQVKVGAGISAGKGGITWSTDVTDLRTPVVAVGGILPAYGETATAPTRASSATPAAHSSAGTARPGCRTRAPWAGSPRPARSPPRATPASTATPPPVCCSAGTARPG